jgi:pectate lyase
MQSLLGGCSRPPRTGPTLFSDTFEGDAPGTVPAGWTVAGGTWTVGQGSGTDTTSVVSQTDTTTTDNGVDQVMELVGGNSSWTDYTVQAEAQAPSSGAFGLMARRQDANNNYQFLLKNGDEWYLGGRQNGTWFTLASGTFSYTAGTWYTLALSVQGTTITGSINGIDVASVTDATFASGGFSLRTTGTPSFDNVIVSD